MQQPTGGYLSGWRGFSDMDNKYYLEQIAQHRDGALRSSATLATPSLRNQKLRRRDSSDSKPGAPGLQAHFEVLIRRKFLRSQTSFRRAAVTANPMNLNIPLGSYTYHVFSRALGLRSFRIGARLPSSVDPSNRITVPDIPEFH